MKKILFVTNLNAACSGMLTNESYEPLLFVACNKLAGSDCYGIFVDGKGISNGRNFIEAGMAIQDAAEMYGADMILPIKQPQLKKWFGKDYTDKLKGYKEELSQVKREEREKKKLVEESKKGRVNTLWLKSKSGYWN